MRESGISSDRPVSPGETGGRWARLAIALAAVIAVGAAGGFLTGLGVGDWYPTLRKPSWTPPPWVFGPAWTALYLAMALAAWLVWRKLPFRGGLPLALFAVQLLLNGAWSGIFFGLRRPDLAFGEIVILWLAIGATAWSFFRVSKVAGWLLVPYLAWVTFAAALNLAVWRLNA
jgi:benzodiazapine receptor